jgi:hypothetical protein
MRFIMIVQRERRAGIESTRRMAGGGYEIQADISGQDKSQKCNAEY